MKITKVIGYALSSRYGDGKVLGQPLGVKSIGFVEVHTDEGLTGFGEAYSGIYVPELMEPVIDFLGSRMLGMDPTDPEKIANLVQIPFVSRNGLVSNLYSAIDIALWDIKSQALALPLHKVLNPNGLGNKRVYASGGSAAFQPDELRRDVDKVLALGFDSFKMRVGHQAWERDLERVTTVREALGSERFLMVDAIMGSINPPWSSAVARTRLKDLAVFRPYWVEEPLHPSDLPGLIELHADSPVKIATGEALSGSLEYSSYLASGAVDIMQLDVTHCGGITKALEIVGMAKRFGVPLAMHVWGSGVAMAANAHLAFAANEVEWLEIPMVDLEISAQMASVKTAIKNGRMTAPTSVGLGVSVTREMKERYRFVTGSGFRL